MSQNTLFDKVWDLHKVSSLPGGSDQIFIGLHLIHEVTSPQAFGALKDKNLKVKFPSRTVATVDHIVPTDNQSRPFKDNLAEQMIETLENNCLQHKIKFFNIGSGNQGIVHVVAPELGLTQPGMTIACGDSHTSTHGAFGSIAFGIGTSQVRDVLATQTIAMNKLKVRQIWCENNLSNGVYAKDLVLHIINELGVKAGVGFAYEFAGPAIDELSMEERMTICNMSIEGGARCGYINPDEKTFSYIKNRLYAPKHTQWDKALLWWKSLKSDENSIYDDVIKLDASKVEPTVTWGITPGQSLGINQLIPLLDDLPPNDQFIAEEAFEYMGFMPGQSIKDTPVDVCFIGSCTNGRISDLRVAAKILKDKKVSKKVKAFVVPGSEKVATEAKEEGLDKIFKDSGFQWREPGCSMCLAMNSDKLIGNQVSASSSNRNFKGRQGSPSGRTLLMSPAMVAAAAINGKVSDVREFINK
ncbi:3-isopropylmalate dehydratase, large subunit [Prochlorococcus marinus str. MIT 9312]|uniref:3-isopropylmalate dehydratase large subunit n=1 Tax=Prochlorococcus marinus (strain MIT 9312) TaxID=74546 RepID=LEUC_PROM9|nr:3-isopropylmalate dehydratase large subunit [Prochlorococcus marinus]Q31CS6.1 RecName: Full=3-isopropylmalate dehydratase large subunit; AltName: Full=Alpha-IPM isomerase; Short=IPMI; AltName: Full=Isopropylmalate isomerase [Prochlorococcus marinus str. MIT 9312]ABB49319.1 3-isopropylmalate dehydratase, large subunit [Prochlorococcus marinus str. MIT 9312]KGG00915.1 3-isopropylmalate dehydratase large subunit [Prochlorococcus marinus str. MIT 9311]